MVQGSGQLSPRSADSGECYTRCTCSGDSGHVHGPSEYHRTDTGVMFARWSIRPRKDGVVDCQWTRLETRPIAHLSENEHNDRDKSSSVKKLCDVCG